MSFHLKHKFTNPNLKRFVLVSGLVATIVLCGGCEGKTAEESIMSFLERVGMSILFAFLALLCGAITKMVYRGDAPEKGESDLRPWYFAARTSGLGRAQSVETAVAIDFFGEIISTIVRYLVPPILTLVFSVSAVGYLVTGENIVFDNDDIASESAPAPENCKYKINRDVVNVRSGPGTSYKKTGRLGNGSTFALQSLSGEWCEIHPCNIVGIEEGQPNLKYGWVYCPLTNVPESN